MVMNGKQVPSREPLAVIVGPTAVGKTALSLPVARLLDAEILNIDSRQLYRYMDIGTAKPTFEQRTQVTHHLLDVLSPHQKSTAAQFVAMARAVLDDVRRRQKRVLLVAGSGLYLRALLYGLMPVPAADDALRRELQAYAEQYGTPALHRRLAHVDPVAASSYHPHDRVRLIRALEVTYLTGEPFSCHQQRHQRQAMVYPYVGVALTRERSELYRRIADRTDAMLAAGWVEEVKTLLAQGYTPECAAMNSLGYRELLAYVAGKADWPTTVARIQQATRRLAKRQLTWFRKFPGLRWLDLSGVDEHTAVRRIVDGLRPTTSHPDDPLHAMHT